MTTASRVSSTSEIDPSFIFLSPTALQRSDFEAATDEVEPVEPRVVESSIGISTGCGRKTMRSATCTASATACAARRVCMTSCSR